MNHEMRGLSICAVGSGRMAEYCQRALAVGLEAFFHAERSTTSPYNKLHEFHSIWLHYG